MRNEKTLTNRWRTLERGIRSVTCVFFFVALSVYKLRINDVMHRIALVIQYIILGRSLYSHLLVNRNLFRSCIRIWFSNNAQIFMYVFMIMQTIFYVELQWQPINVLK